MAHTNGLFNALAVNALESLLDAGHDHDPVLGFTPASPPSDAQSAAPQASLAAINAFVQNPPQMLLLYEANPIFSAPPGIRIRETIRKIPYIVSFGSFIDETSAQADLILPDHSSLESGSTTCLSQAHSKQWLALRRLPSHRCTIRVP